MSYNYGYREGAKMARELGMKKGGKVAVKAHSRAPRVAKPPMPVAPPPAPPMAQPDMSQMPAPPMGAGGMKKGGKVSAKEPPKAAPPSKDIPKARDTKHETKMAKGGKAKR